MRVWFEAVEQIPAGNRLLLTHQYFPFQVHFSDNAFLIAKSLEGEKSTYDKY